MYIFQIMSGWLHPVNIIFNVKFKCTCWIVDIQMGNLWIKTKAHDEHLCIKYCDYFSMLPSYNYMTITFASKAVCQYISTFVQRIFKLAWITNTSCQYCSKTARRCCELSSVLRSCSVEVLTSGRENRKAGEQ